MAPPEWEARLELAPEQPVSTPVAEPVETVVAAPERRPLWSFLREALETVLLTILIFVGIRAVVQNFRIEGFSMEPTLHAGQFLIVNKLIYNLQSPQRGDVIVFEYPRAPDRDFIKRVIGLPGEKVEVKGGRVFINGKPIDEFYLAAPPGYSMGPITVPEDEYFVLGDNRNNSSDSHSWGTLPKKNIIGKAWISYWPPQYWGFIPDSRYSLASAD
jgi:signal peptidase I